MLERTATLMALRRGGRSRGSGTASWQATQRKGALGCWRHGSIWWPGMPSGPPSSWQVHLSLPVLHLPCQPLPDPSHIPLQKPDGLPDGTSLGRKACAQCCASCSALEGSPSTVPEWTEMAQIVLLRACPSFHPLETLLCAAFCIPEAVVPGLRPLAQYHCLFVPISALHAHAACHRVPGPSAAAPLAELAPVAGRGSSVAYLT
jgi:hypothetical protein